MTGFFFDFRLRRRPHEGQIVWLGAYRDWRYAAWARHQALHVGIPSDEPPNALCLRVHGLPSRLQMVGQFDRGVTFNGGRLLAAALARVWPSSGQSVDWPPKKLAFGGDSLGELAQSVKG